MNKSRTTVKPTATGSDDRRERRYQKLCATIERTQRQLDKADKTVSRCIRALTKLERQRRRLDKARAEQERQTADSLVTALAEPEPSPAPPTPAPVTKESDVPASPAEPWAAKVFGTAAVADLPKTTAPAEAPTKPRRARKPRRTEDDFKRDVAAKQADARGE